MNEEQYKQLMKWISECVDNVQIIEEDEFRLNDIEKYLTKSCRY